MKKTCLVSTMFLLMLNSTAWGTIIHGYHNEQLTIETGLPPAVLVVEDSAGRRTGADRTKPFDQDGWQVGPDGTEYSAGLQEIPNSDIEEQNVANEENPTGLNYSNPSTGWEVHIKDGGNRPIL